MPKGKAIALLFSQNSEIFTEFCNFAPNSKSAKRQSYSLTIFTKFRNFHGIFYFEPNSKSAKRQGYSLTIFTKLRKFHGILQFCSKFKKCQIDRYFVPKSKTIALIFFQNFESFKEFFNFSPNSKSAKRQAYSLTVFRKLRMFHGIS